MCRLVFVSVVRNPGLYARCVSSNVFNAGADFVCFDNTRDNVGVAGRYNSFLDSYDYSKPAWFVFCHEDWELLEDIRPKLAGLPEEVISRAQDILENLENNSIAEAGQPSLVTKSRYMIRDPRQKYRKDKTDDGPIQPSLFDQ